MPKEWLALTTQKIIPLSESEVAVVRYFKAIVMRLFHCRRSEIGVASLHCFLTSDAQAVREGYMLPPHHPPQHGAKKRDVDRKIGAHGINGRVGGDWGVPPTTSRGVSGVSFRCGSGCAVARRHHLPSDTSSLRPAIPRFTDAKHSRVVLYLQGEDQDEDAVQVVRHSS